jgi:hypothetical protein
MARINHLVEEKPATPYSSFASFGQLMLVRS